MKQKLFVATIFGFASLLSFSAGAAEAWKGKPPGGEFLFGFGGGISQLGSLGGVPLIGNVAAKIVHLGFVPDMNNQVWIEAAGGVHLTFNGGFTSGLFSTHLRWDFVKDDYWTFFAVGGVGGAVISVAGLTSYIIHPRFGVGGVYYFLPQMGVRLDLSHEWMTLGLQVQLP